MSRDVTPSVSMNPGQARKYVSKGSPGRFSGWNVGSLEMLYIAVRARVLLCRAALQGAIRHFKLIRWIALDDLYIREHQKISAASVAGSPVAKRPIVHRA